MKSGAQIGLAVAAGYVLGRLRKMKWAMALATMAGRKRLASQGGGVLKQGTKLLQSSPELSKLTDDIKGTLVDAGKTAAIAAVGSRITSLSEGLRERSESLRAGSKTGSGSQADEQADGQADGQADDQSDEQADDQSDEQADDQADEQADEQADDQSDRASGDAKRARPRKGEGRARPDGDHRKSRSSDRPSRRGAAEEKNVPRPRRQAASEASGQRSRRKRETAR